MVQFRVMKPTDAPFFLEAANMVGWGMTQQDFNRIIRFSPKGSFIASENGEKVGFVVTTIYGDIGWVGNLIVLPKNRQKGIGSSLMFHAMNHLQENGVKAIRLDAVQEAIPLYRRLGFREENWSLRHKGGAKKHRTMHTRLLSNRDLPAVYILDYMYFKAHRKPILDYIYSQNPELCWTAWDEKDLIGYIMAKDGVNNVKVGPWICDPLKPEIAEQLLHSVMNMRLGEELWIGTPEGNDEAVRIIEENSFVSLPSSLRMCYGSCNIKEKIEGIFGLGGPDKG
jgi:GNAT superfamily N-acetyltransferase